MNPDLSSRIKNALDALKGKFDDAEQQKARITELEAEVERLGEQLQKEKNGHRETSEQLATLLDGVESMTEDDE